MRPCKCSTHCTGYCLGCFAVPDGLRAIAAVDFFVVPFASEFLVFERFAPGVFVVLPLLVLLALPELGFVEGVLDDSVGFDTLAEPGFLALPEPLVGVLDCPAVPMVIFDHRTLEALSRIAPGLSVLDFSWVSLNGFC